MKLNQNKRVMFEDDGGGAGWGGDMGGYGGFGMGGMGSGGNIVSDQLIYKTFISGWVDLFKTAKSATKSIAASSIATLKIALASVVNAVIPWYKENYDAIFEQLKKSQQTIRQQHEPVYRSIVQSLLENDDFLVSAFFYDPKHFFNTAITNPSTFVTTMGALKAPGAVAETLDVLTGGGMLGKALKNTYGSSKDWTQIQTKLKTVLGSAVMSKLFGQMGETNLHSGDFLLLEETSDSKQDSLTKDQITVIKLLLNPEVIKQVLSSSEAKSLVTQQHVVVDKALAEVVKTVQQLQQTNDVQQIIKLTGKDIKDVDKLSDEEKQKLVSEIKSTVQKLYVKMLSTELEHLAKYMPKNHALVQAYAKAIKAIS
jgi:hypothetical protein